MVSRIQRAFLKDDLQSVENLLDLGTVEQLMLRLQLVGSRFPLIHCEKICRKVSLQLPIG